MVGYDAAERKKPARSRLERKPVPDTTFTILKGYRVMDLGEMMAGMQGPRRRSRHRDAFGVTA
jgi:hypothetical protein